MPSLRMRACRVVRFMPRSWRRREAGNVPVRLAEGAEDVLAFGFFQGGD